jgi:plasmid stabilization system protein ParE
MAYRVELTFRAFDDLDRHCLIMEAVGSEQASAWFNGLQAAIFSLSEHPARRPVTPENRRMRHLLYGQGRHVYRVIYTIDETTKVVKVAHIRRGAQRPFE